MNYIYDILLNFQDEYYNFFEWKKEDVLKNVKKVSLYRVSDKDLIFFKNNQVKITSTFLETLKNANKKHKNIICLVSNGKLAIGLLFDDNGTLLKRSSLLFEEEEEAIDGVKDLKEMKIDYDENIEVLSTNNLRVEKEKKEIIINYISKNCDKSTLKYLYYEYFEQESNSKTVMKKQLIKELSKPWTKKQNNLYKIINILTKSK